ncbi:MAG: hypothetical protein GOU98_04640 [Candidatus Altiarchaeota archaeon]|nr:hypothetical protein [Candidatus Altiarchaeota archaeon]
MSDYYPSYYWVQPTNYPNAPQTKNTLLPWAIIFLLILASFYTIYLYIQPDFVLEDTACSKQYVVLKLITAKAGRFFMGEFETNLAGIEYTKKITSTVTEGEKLDVVFKVGLAPGTYSGEAYFRGEILGDFSCTVR